MLHVTLITKASSPALSQELYRAPSGTLVTETSLTPTATATAACQDYSYSVDPGTMIGGTFDIGNACDDCSTTITLPFAVNLYGQTFTTAQAGSNGFLGFGSVWTHFDNSCLPRVGITYKMAPFWVDQLTAGRGCVGCGIFTATVGTAPNRTFVVEYRTIYFNQTSESPTLRYEIQLQEGQSTFKYVYGVVTSFNADSALTIGVQKSKNPDIYTSYYCDPSGDVAPPLTGKQIIWYYPPCGSPTALPTSTSTATPTQTRTSTATATIEPELAILQYVKNMNPLWNCQGPSGTPGHRRLTACIGSAGHVADGIVDNYGSGVAAQAQWQSRRQAAQSYPIFGDTTFGNGYPGYFAGNNNFPYAYYETYFWGSRWVMGAAGQDDTNFRFAPNVATAIFNAARTLGYLPNNPPPLETATPTPTGTLTITPLTATSTSTTSTSTSTVTATAIATTVTPTPCTLTFTDVDESSPFYVNIRCLACRGILSGYTDGTFRPNLDIIRGQIAKIVSNSAGFNESPDPQIYEDVAPTNPFYQWINRLSRRGHMGGYNCGLTPEEPCGVESRPYFRPFANATRGQLAKIVSNAAGLGGTPTGIFYTDVQEDNSFYVWIMRLTTLNVMSGYPCGGPNEPCDEANRPYFRPYNNVTRGQTAKMVAGTFFPNCQTP